MEQSWPLNPDIEPSPLNPDVSPWLSPIPDTGSSFRLGTPNPPPPTVDEQEEAKSEGVEVSHSQVIWCGLDGVLRSKAIFHPYPHYCRLTRHGVQHIGGPYPRNLHINGIGVSRSVVASVAHANGTAPNSNGIDKTGEIRLIPDVRPKRMRYHKGINAMVYQGFMHSIHDRNNPTYFCSRSILRKVYDDFQKLKLDLHVGFETEFVILNNKKEPIETQNFCSSRGLDTASDLLHDIALELQFAGVRVGSYHKESGNGQFEISSGVYFDPLEACDDMLFTRKIISEVVHRRGLVASFLPKLSASTAGRNLIQDICNVARENNYDWSGEIKSDSCATKFLAGILRHLPALLALTCPTRNSFRRLVPGAWVGAWLCWGIDNREVSAAAAPLRLCDMNYVQDVNLEYKSFDATANPHIGSGLAGIIAAGLEGIENDYPLPSPVQVDPDFILSGPAPPSLPRDPEESISKLMHGIEGKAIRKALGNEVISLIAAIRSFEAEHFQDSSLEYEVDTLFDTY